MLARDHGNLVSYFTTGDPGEKHRTHKPPPTRRIQERSKGDITYPTTPQNPSRWHLSWLSNAGTTKRDPDSEWLARDNLEAHSIAIKPKTASHMVGQFSWVLLPSCSPPRHPFPTKSLALSACVSPWTIHFLVLDKSPLSGPGRGPTSCHMLSVLERETERKTEGQTEARPTSTLAFDPLPHAQPSPCLPTYSPIFTPPGLHHNGKGLQWNQNQEINLPRCY